MKTKHPTYAVHSSIQMVVTWVDRLKAKTGRSLEEWACSLRASAGFARVLGRSA